MELKEIMNSLVVQGELMEIDTSEYEKVLRNFENVTTSDDPVSRASSLVFRMCQDGALDPWNIDLVAFVKFFREIVNEEYTNLSFAGYLIAEAWKILYLKTLSTVDYQTEEELEPLQDDVQGENIETEERVMELRVPVVGHLRRPVRMVELLDAMKTAYLRGQRESRGRTPVVAQGSFEDIIQNLNMDEPEQDIANLHKIISSIQADSFYMEDYWGTTPEEKSTFFVYSLFLMRERRIRLRQDNPYTDILIMKVDM